MSHHPSRVQRPAPTAARRAASRLAILFTLFLGLAGITPALGQAADATVTASDLCNAWNASTTNPSVTLSSGYKITGSQLVRSGADCNAGDASVAITNSTIAEVATGSGSNAASRMLAAAVQTAVGTNDVKVGDEVFKGATIRTLTATLQNGFIGIKGGLELNWTGGTVTKLQFSGRFYATDRYSLVLTSPSDGTLLPNLGGSPLMFTGDLVKDSAGYHMSLTGSATSIVYGTGDKQLTVSDAALKMTLADVTNGDGLKLTATGGIGVGASQIVKLTNGSITAAFDHTGLQTVSGSGSVSANIPASGSLPAGTVSGDGTIDYTTGGAQTLSFSNGQVKIADATVTGAKGTLDAQSASFTGDAALSNASLSIKSSIDGVVFYGTDLTGLTVQDRSGKQVQAQKGDAVLKATNASISVKNLDITGAAQIGVAGGEEWASANGDVDASFSVAGLPDTSIKGSAALSWVNGSGATVSFTGAVSSGSTAIASAKGDVDGNKISITGDATLSNPDLTVSGAVDGVVYYGDNSGDQLTSKAGTKVDAKKGDFVLKSASAQIKSKGFELSGAAQMARVGGDRWASGGGDVDLTLNNTSLKGHADMTWVAGEIPSVTFSGSMKQGTTTVANASGSVDGNQLSLKGDATFVVNGATINAAAEGTLFYGSDLSGLTLADSTGTQVPASKGDWILKTTAGGTIAPGLTGSGAISLGSIGGKQWVSASAAIDVTYNGTHITGSAALGADSAGKPVVNFAGTVTNNATMLTNLKGTIDSKKITFTGDASVVTTGASARATAEGVLYYGDPAGDTLPNADGTQVAAQKGDLLVKSVSVDAKIIAKGVAASGNVTIGKVAGKTYAAGGGTVTLAAANYSLKGSAGFTWAEGTPATATFSGSVVSGTMAVVNASGTLDGKLLTFKGDAFLTDAAAGWKASGAVEGSLWYLTPGTTGKITGADGTQVAAAKGDLYVKAASGKLDAKNLSLAGTVTGGKTGTKYWINGDGAIDTTFGTPATTLKGTATFSWATGTTGSLSFDGTVTSGATTLKGKGTLDGKKIALTGTAAYSATDLSISGGIDGTFYYGDPAGDTLPDASGKQVAAAKGDFVVNSASGSVTVKNLDLKGAVTLGKVAGSMYASGGGSVDFTSGGTNVKGNATFDWASGQAPTVSFSGSVTSGTTTVANAAGTIDGKKIVVKGDVTYTNTGITATAAIEGGVYYGDPAGDTLPDASGKQVAAQKGDFVLKSASAQLQIKNLAVAGNLAFAKVAGKSYASGGGAVDVTQASTNLKGSATFAWSEGGSVTATFTGTVTSGSTIVANATGTLDGKKLSVSGDATIKDPAYTASGSVDGVVYYADPAGDTITGADGSQVAAAKGDLYVKTAAGKLDAKNLSLAGVVTGGKLGTKYWVSGQGGVDTTFGTPATTLKGTATFTWATGTTGTVSFDGTVNSGAVTLKGKGTMDGKKIALSGTVDYSATDLVISGAIDGAFYYADPAGDTLPDASGKQVAAQKGDFVVKSASGSATVKNLALTGNVTLGKVAGSLYASGGGSVDLTSGGTSLKGNATFDWASGQTPTVNFSGSVTSGTTTVANASGTIDGKKIAVKGDVTYTTTGVSATATIDGVLYYGDPAGDTLPDASGKQVAALKGDFVLKSASAQLQIKNLAVGGNLAFAKVAGKSYASGGGSVDATQASTNLKGSATFAWTEGGSVTATFTGTLTSGSTVVANASGALDGKKLSFSGDATIKDTAYTASGSVNGVVFYADPAGDTITGADGSQVAAAKGDLYVKAASGKLDAKNLSLAGTVTGGKLGTKYWVNGGGSVDTTFGTPATTLKGTATFTWATGTTGSLSFDGTVNSGAVTLTGKGTLDGKKVALSGTVSYSATDLAISGGIDATVYYADPAGDTLPDASGKQVAAQKGDFVIKGASGSVTVKNLAVSGSVSLAKVAGSMYASGTGSVDATQGTTNLKGSATFSWAAGGAVSVTFTGSITSGTTVIANAAGAFDGKKIALKADGKVTTSSFTLSGAIEGVYYYGDPAGDTITNEAGAQVAASKGDFYVKSATGSLVMGTTTLTGNVSGGSIAGKLWTSGGGSIDYTFGSPATTIKGTAAFKVGSNGVTALTFDGTVTQGDYVLKGSGTMDGKKIAFTGSLSSPSVSGSATGVVYYGKDLSGETIVNRSGATVAASQGDFRVDFTGNAVLKQLTASASGSVSKVGAVAWVKVNADIKVGASWVTFKGELDTTGNVNLQGSGSVVMNGYKVNFIGSAVVQNNALTLNGTVDVVTSLFGVRLTGTITKADMNSSEWSFVGAAGFRFGGYTVAGATVRFTTGEGIATTFQIKPCVLFLCTTGTYKVYFTDADISKIQVSAPIVSIAVFSGIAKLAAPNAPLETTITGLI